MASSLWSVLLALLVALCLASQPSSAATIESASPSSANVAPAAATTPTVTPPAPPAPPAVAADAPIVGHWCNAFPQVVIAIDAAGRVEMDGEGHHMCELLAGAREVRKTIELRIENQQAALLL